MGNPINIKNCSIRDLENDADITTLVLEYYNESAIDGLPKPDPQWRQYEAMEKLGLLHVIGAHEEDKLIGFAIILTTSIPHYGKVLAVTESIFVKQEYRKCGTGIKLMKKIEEVAKNAGAIGLLMSAPTGGTLALVLDRSNYVHTNVVYYRAL